jgi:hypothetical protein
MDATESLTVKDIVPLRGPRPSMSTTVIRHGPPDRHTVTRRRFTQAALAAATGLGLASLGVFPPARQAFADGYDMIQGCNGLQYSNCAGCCCSTLCRSSGCCNSSDFHRNDGVNWLLRTNQCKGSGGVSGKDGWWWDLPANAGCGCGSKRTRWKCHDGWTIVPGPNIPSTCNTGPVCF